MPSDCSSSDDIIISTYVQETSPVLTLLVIYAVLGAMCLPLLLAVFFFSTPRIRRTPLFIVVVFDILLGVAIACWMVSFTLGNLLKPLTAARSESTRLSFIAMVFITFISPWVIDLVLLLRLYAVFPIASTPKRIICAVFASTTCIKAARLGFCVANMVLWVHSVPQDPLASLYSSNNAGAVHSWLAKVVAACELSDHFFVAACFLWKIRVLGFGSRPQAVRPKDNASVSLTHRMRVMCYIALSNFVFPVIFKAMIAPLIYVDSLNFMFIMYLEPINMYVNIFGIVFATVWSSGHPPVTTPAVLSVVEARNNPLRAYGAHWMPRVELKDMKQDQKMGECTLGG